MSANPHANGGAADARAASCRISATTPSTVDEPGARRRPRRRGDGHVSARRDALQRGDAQFPRLRPGRDRLQPPRQAVFEATDRAWDAETVAYDDHLAPDGRVMEILSEHTCQGWLEGYLLTGRHGFFSATRPSSTSSIRCSTSMPNG